MSSSLFNFSKETSARYSTKDSEIVSSSNWSLSSSNQITSLEAEMFSFVDDGRIK
jgi:hypothetical protein